MSGTSSALVGGCFALAVAACAHERAPVYSPQAIDAIARDCQRRIEVGAVDRWRRTTDQVGTRVASGHQDEARVVVYGASWCRACDAAAQYLTQRHVPFVERDVETDREADRDARDALAEAGLDADRRSLPIIVVGRTVMIGFRPCIVEDALATGDRG